VLDFPLFRTITLITKRFLNDICKIIFGEPRDRAFLLLVLLPLVVSTFAAPESVTQVTVVLDRA